MSNIDKIRQKIERLKGYISVTHFAEELLPFIDSLPDQPVEGLEEAARLYAIPHDMRDVDVNYLDEYPYNPVAEEDFIAGARWQKEQMLKEAVEGKVVELGETYKDLSISVGGKELNEVLQPLGVKDGDKVKVIIVKEAEK